MKNPPGYSGMERDTTMVPPSATTSDSLTDSTKSIVPIDSTKWDSTAKHGKHTDSTKVGDSDARRSPKGRPTVSRPTRLAKPQ